MNMFRKQGVAWTIAILMIAAAIFIGQSPRTQSPEPSVPSPGATAGYYVYDDAGVLSASEVTKLSQRNHNLLDDMDVSIACVTTNYGKSDLYNFALDYAAKINLSEYDFIVVLDISGDNYWLVQGAGLVDLFSDDDCSAYAATYMERDFAQGKYGDALLSLTKELSQWYYDHY